MFTSIVPGYLTGLAVFVSGWFTYNAPDGPPGKPVEIMAGLIFFAACTAGFEVFSRLGFKQFRLQQYAAKLTPELKVQLTAFFHSASLPGQGMHPTVVELGQVPMLMVGGDVPGQLWISTYTLANTPTEVMPHLLAHERAHLESDTMLDRVLVSGGYWWICGVSVMLLVSNPLLCALWLLVASGVFLRVNAVRLGRLELRADRLAVKATTLEGYSRAIATHLAQFEPGNNNELARGRLRRIGLSAEKQDEILGA